MSAQALTEDSIYYALVSDAGGGQGLLIEILHPNRIDEEPIITLPKYR